MENNFIWIVESHDVSGKAMLPDCKWGAYTSLEFARRSVYLAMESMHESLQEVDCDVENGLYIWCTANTIFTAEKTPFTQF